MEDLSIFVPKVHFEQIPIKNLVSNQEYQRNLSQAHMHGQLPILILTKSIQSK